MNYIDIIKKACIKNDPSILDLVMGCEVKTTGGVVKTIGNGTVKDMEYQECDYYTYFSIIEILGRPITLQDVLRVLPKKFLIGADKFIYEFEEDGDVYSEGFMYDFSKSLQNQPEEVLKFISENLPTNQ